MANRFEAFCQANDVDSGRTQIVAESWWKGWKDVPYVTASPIEEPKRGMCDSTSCKWINRCTGKVLFTEPEQFSIPTVTTVYFIDNIVPAILDQDSPL
jgi:hypothetical protein